MSNKIIKPLTLAVGAAFIGTVTLSQMVHANSAFQVKPLISGYMLAHAEGKCGEGKCAVAKMDTNKDGKVSMAEAKDHNWTEAQFKAGDTNGDGFVDASELTAVHASMDMKGKEGHCSADKMKGHEGSCTADKMKGTEGHCSGDKMKGHEGCCSAEKMKGKEGSCSADKMKGKEGSCSADKKGKEGSCSADKKGKEGSCSSH